jgi:hypothetical protein
MHIQSLSIFTSLCHSLPFSSFLTLSLSLSQSLSFSQSPSHTPPLLLFSSSLTHTQEYNTNDSHSPTYTHAHSYAPQDPHKQNDIENLNESNFKGIVIGGTYQHCFENCTPVVAHPSGMDKRVTGVSFSVSNHLELKLYIPKDDDTKVISVGCDWRWINTSPDGYLVCKGLFSAKKKLICYYLPRHPVEWATEVEREGSMSGFAKMQSADTCSSSEYYGTRHNSMILRGSNSRGNFGDDRDMTRDGVRGERDRDGREREGMDGDGEGMVIGEREDREEREDEVHYLDVEMDCQDGAYSPSIDVWDDIGSSLTLPLRSKPNQGLFYAHSNAETFVPSCQSTSFSTLDHVLCDYRTYNAVDDEDQLVLSLLKSSNADLNCPHIISFVLEYLLGEGR